MLSHRQGLFIVVKFVYTKSSLDGIELSGFLEKKKKSTRVQVSIAFQHNIVRQTFSAQQK